MSLLAVRAWLGVTYCFLFFSFCFYMSFSIFLDFWKDWTASNCQNYTRQNIPYLGSLTWLFALLYTHTHRYIGLNKQMLLLHRTWCYHCIWFLAGSQPANRSNCHAVDVRTKRTDVDLFGTDQLRESLSGQACLIGTGYANTTPWQRGCPPQLTVTENVHVPTYQHICGAIAHIITWRAECTLDFYLLLSLACDILEGRVRGITTSLASFPLDGAELQQALETNI